MDFLVWLEDLLIRMIRGIFQFTFQKVPVEIYRAVVRWFPTLVRGVKVIGLALFWLALTFGPLACVIEHERLAPINQSLAAQHSAHRIAVNIAVYIHTGLATIGSGWGIYYVRRRRRKQTNGRQKPPAGRPVQPPLPSKKPERV